MRISARSRTWYWTPWCRLVCGHITAGESARVEIFDKDALHHVPVLGVLPDGAFQEGRAGLGHGDHPVGGLALGRHGNLLGEPDDHLEAVDAAPGLRSLVMDLGRKQGGFDVRQLVRLNDRCNHFHVSVPLSLMSGYLVRKPWKSG